MAITEAKTTSEPPSQTEEPHHESRTHPPNGEPASDSDTDSLLAKLESELDLSSDTVEDNHAETTLSPTIASLQAALVSEIQSQSRNTPLSGRTIISPQSRGIQVPASEATLIRATADAPAAIVVFYSTSFASSLRMKDLLSELAREYVAQHSSTRNDTDAAETVFFAAEAEKCEWLCRRLNVKVLPVVVGYIDGKEVGRLVGFEGLKNGEKAGWQSLAWVVGRWDGSWIGTLGRDRSESILGRNWAEWTGSREVGRGDRRQDSSEESDEDGKETRRKAGFIGGSNYGFPSCIRYNRQQQGTGLDEDDEWE